MAYCGYIVEVKELRKHSNADRLQVATFFGNDVCVDLSVKLGDVGVYFPTDGQLSEEYCNYNNLVRKKDDAGNNIGGYMDPEKRNVKTIKLRGEKSDGLYMPLTSFDYLKTHEFNVGDTITVVDGHEICCKYIPRGNTKGPKMRDGNRTRKKKVPVAPLFKEHADTEQLAYNLEAFRPGDEVEITLKMHGTSQRTGYLPVFKKYKKSLLDLILRRDGTPIYDWGYVSGTRRTVLDNFDGGFYGSNTFREQHSKTFEGKLLKGETVYYEIVAYVNKDTPIMSRGDVPKDYQNIYGKTMTFSYGCEPGDSAMYIYRMTMTNEDGDVIEYTPDFMRYRVEQMGLNCVPVFTKFIIPADEPNPGEYVKNICEQYYDGPDPVGKTHVREGVVVRIINRPKFCAYKYKNFLFKCITSNIKDNLTDTQSLSDDIISEL
jgi:hypothetical protein